ncbi:MAG TPA: AmmeMemoRadiSam system protein A [Burkholderiales bacterium]|jgi:AmmeMemoRadiSam system protein A|nr:AmmeMemoRadiSam system protein A [Burkholderiales bacterium]
MNPAGADKGTVLLCIARASIGSRFGLHLPSDEQPAFLHEPAASFVTLKLEGRLRGCIGSLQASRPLGEDVKLNAQAAAFSDPRFQPLSAVEFRDTRIEVSVLSPLLPIAFGSEDEALAALRPNEDGVVLAWREQRSTFLPQVWESVQEPRAFLAELKRKAGLPMQYWSEEIRLYRYRVEKWSEAQ